MKYLEEERVCANCRHFRQAEMRERNGEPITLGYCHATKNFAYRTPDYYCKRWNYVKTL